MKKLTILSTIAFIIFGFTGFVSANLLTNGDFETLDDRVGTVNSNQLDSLGTSSPTWDVFDSIPGWTSGSNDSGIEVQYNNTVVNAHSPYHYIELDSHPSPGNSSMEQSVYLDTGMYNFEFYYQPRTNDLDDNGINYYVGNLFSWSVDDTANNWTDWDLVSRVFQIDVAGIYTVGFSAFGDFGTTGGNTLGGFIDDVSLTAAPVPEPATMLLLGTGLVGLAGAGRKKFLKK